MQMLSKPITVVALAKEALTLGKLPTSPNFRSPFQSLFSNPSVFRFIGDPLYNFFLSVILFHFYFSSTREYSVGEKELFLL